MSRKEQIDKTLEIVLEEYIKNRGTDDRSATYAIAKDAMEFLLLRINPKDLDF